MDESLDDIKKKLLSEAENLLKNKQINRPNSTHPIMGSTSDFLHTPIESDTQSSASGMNGTPSNRNSRIISLYDGALADGTLLAVWTDDPQFEKDPFVTIRFGFVTMTMPMEHFFQFVNTLGAAAFGRGKF